MSANLTDSDKEFIFVMTTTIYTVFSIIIVISFAALLLIKSINLQLRTLLVNMFAVELLYWVFNAILFPRYPKRVFSWSLVSCCVATSLSQACSKQFLVGQARKWVWFSIESGCGLVLSLYAQS